MPMPEKDETKEEFIKRFMSDEEAVDDYPTERQRRAVAEAFWQKHLENKRKK